MKTPWHTWKLRHPPYCRRCRRTTVPHYAFGFCKTCRQIEYRYRQRNKLDEKYPLSRLGPGIPDNP